MAEELATFLDYYIINSSNLSVHKVMCSSKGVLGIIRTHLHNITSHDIAFTLFNVPMHYIVLPVEND